MAMQQIKYKNRYEIQAVFNKARHQKDFQKYKTSNHNVQLIVH